MKRLNSDTRNKMTDETCMPACRPTTEIKVDIDFATTTKKQKIVLLICWCVVYLFASRKSLFLTNTQTT